jgi:hypothetical protein
MPLGRNPLQLLSYIFPSCRIIAASLSITISTPLNAVVTVTGLDKVVGNGEVVADAVATRSIA